MRRRLLTSILTFYSEISHFILKKKKKQACVFASVTIQITYEQKSLASFF